MNDDINELKPAPTLGDLPGVEPPPQTLGDLTNAQTPAARPGGSPSFWGHVGDNLGQKLNILTAFGYGFKEQWDGAQFGPGLKKLMEDHGVLYDGKRKMLPTDAFNEAFLRPVVNGLDVALRLATGVFGGVHDAAVEGGKQGDPVLGAAAGAMEAFPLFGAELGGLHVPQPKSPYTGGTGRAPDLRVAKDLEVIGPPRPPLSEGTPAQAAANVIRDPTTPYGSPKSFEAFIKDGEPALLTEPPKEGDFFQVTVHAEDAASFEKSPDWSQVEITHRNGEPTRAAVPAVTAADMDLIMRSEPLPPTKGGVESNPWQERFDEWVQKLEVPDDVRNLIRNAAAKNDTFPEARSGQIPEAHLGALSDVTGIPRDQLPEANMRLIMRNDDEFRVAAQLMIKTNDDVFEAARLHKAGNSFETRQALVAAIMRRDLALEGVLGLRAEWGRTGNVMQEFLEATKDAQGLGRFIKDKKGEGWNSAKVDEVAQQLGSLNSREAQAHYLTSMRKTDFLDKAIWYWTNALISGVITHTKYVFANAAYLAHDTFVVTPMAGISGTVRSWLGKADFDRVYLGETVAKTYGLIAGTPDAVLAAGRAFRDNIPTPLPPQVKGAGFENQVTNLKPPEFETKAGQVAGAAIALPSRGVSAIHSFFNFLGYRAELEAISYRRAVKDGYNPATPDFWRAQHDHMLNPDEPAITTSIQAGARANFVQSLGPTGKKFQAFLYDTRVGRFIVPFTKVPGNIFNAVQEGTIAAVLDTRMRNDLLGKNGGAAKDYAMGRIAAGGAVMGMAAYWTLQDKITDSGPVDAKQRAEWLLTHQPRSYQVNGQWKSYDQFGPIGGWLQLSASITSSAQHLAKLQERKLITETDRKKYDEELAEAASRTVVGFAHWFEEGGFMSLFNLIEAMNDPMKTKASNAGATVATAIPYSSMIAQQTSFMDPHMRELHSFVDGIKNRLPGLRDTLPVARDWSGAPRANPAFHNIIRSQDVNTDPVDLEMQRLDLKPTKVPDQIKGVKLTQGQYDEFQTLAGTSTRLALTGLVTQPGWAQVPAFARSNIIMSQIEGSRKVAEATMQAKYGNLIGEAIDNKLNVIKGVKPLKGAYERP